MRESRGERGIVSRKTATGLLAILAVAVVVYGRHATDADRLSREMETARAQCVKNAEILGTLHSKYEGVSCSNDPRELEKTRLIGRLDRKDPWGNDIQIDSWHGLVYSKGPDGLDKTVGGPTGGKALDLPAPENADNPSADYLGPARIVKAMIEVNPGGDPDPAGAFDVIHLFFSRRIRFAGARLDLVVDAANDEAAGTGPDAACAKGKILRWRLAKDGALADPRTLFKLRSSNGAPRPVSSIPLAYGFPEDPASNWTGEGKPGRLYHSEDSREIVLALPVGTSGSIVPGAYCIDLTGGAVNASAGNPFFKQTDGVTGGVRSEVPIRIDIYD